MILRASVKHQFQTLCVSEHQEHVIPTGLKHQKSHNYANHQSVHVV